MDDDATLQLDATTSTTTTTTTTASTSTPAGVSALEQDVLDEYARLLGNLDRLSATLATLADGPLTLEIAEGLRLLERKVASVHTLMKASVYSIVLQQGQFDDDAAAAAAAEGGGDEDETTMTE